MFRTGGESPLSRRMNRPLDEHTSGSSSRVCDRCTDGLFTQSIFFYLIGDRVCVKLQNSWIQNGGHPITRPLKPPTSRLLVEFSTSHWQSAFTALHINCWTSNDGHSISSPRLDLPPIRRRDRLSWLRLRFTTVSSARQRRRRPLVNRSP